MHIEKFGNDEVEGIELGKVYIFPKIDGTNASIWKDGCGSRTRELSLKRDNAGFCKAMAEGHRERDFITSNPHLRLFGEWLVPHTFKGYREDAWKKFYIFDVMHDETETYWSYEAYQPLLEQFGLNYIPPLAIINNANYEHFLKALGENRFLCPQDGEPGEGIVIKNYSYYNKYGRQTWAKVIRQEFKEQHYRTMGAPEINAGKMNEERILDRVLTLPLVDKTIAKIVTEKETGWQSKYIPELFGRLLHDIVKEELWDSLKEIEFGAVNFKTLKAVMIMRIKQLKPEFF